MRKVRVIINDGTELNRAFVDDIGNNGNIRKVMDSIPRMTVSVIERLDGKGTIWTVDNIVERGSITLVEFSETTLPQEIFDF